MNLDLQRAGVWKRMSAQLFDFIVLGMITVGLALLASWLLGYDKHVDRVTRAYDEYEIAYGIDFEISEQDYLALPQETKDLYEQAKRAMNRDGEVVYAYSMMYSLALVILSSAILLSHLLLEFLIPLFLKNGQTLGKKIFGVAVMRTNSVKVTGPVLFVRAILGRCTIGRMVPVLLILMILFGNIGIVGTGVLILIALLQVILMCATKNHSAIHDLLADTVVVDMATQRIFESEAELIEFKKKIHAENAARASY